MTLFSSKSSNVHLGDILVIFTAGIALVLYLIYKKPTQNMPMQPPTAGSFDSSYSGYPGI